MPHFTYTRTASFEFFQSIDFDLNHTVRRIRYRHLHDTDEFYWHLANSPIPSLVFDWLHLPHVCRSSIRHSPFVLNALQILEKLKWIMCYCNLYHLPQQYVLRILQHLRYALLFGFHLAHRVLFMIAIVKNSVLWSRVKEKKKEWNSQQINGLIEFNHLNVQYCLLAACSIKPIPQFGLGRTQIGAVYTFD